MKTQNRIFSTFYLVSVILFAMACSKDEAAGGDENGGGDPNEANTFKEVIALGADVESFPESRKEEVLSESEPEDEDYEREEEGNIVKERFICTRKTLSVLDGNGQFPLFDTASDVIYPGSLLQGKSLKNATPSPIVVKRAGGSISYNLINGNSTPSFTVSEVRKSTIQEGMNGIIEKSPQATAANFQLDIIQIESESQMAVELGIDVDTWTTKVSSDMSFSTEESFNRTLVKLTQSYYTMSFDLPTSLDEIFHESVTPDDLKTYVQADNPATFISSVTYGRIFYMLIESTSSRQEMAAKLNVAYGAFGNNVESELEVSAMEELNDLKIKVIAYGGDAAGTFQLAGETNIPDIANKLAESTDIRTGLPLSYVVRSVERPDKIVGTRIATEYDVVNCELKGILPPPGYLALVDLFEDGFGAAAQVSGPNAVLYNKAGTKYAWYNANTGAILGTYDIKDPNGPLGVSSFDSIGAAVNFRDGKIYVFDSTGLFAEIFNFPGCDCDEDALPINFPIGSYRQTTDTEGNAVNDVFPVNTLFGDSSNYFPYAGVGFVAASRYFTNGATSTITHYFGSPGDTYSGYSTVNNGTWGIPNDTNLWGDKSQTHFERVGAACRILIGTNNVRQLFFSEEGTEFTIFNPHAPDTENEFSAPWVVN